MFVVESPFSARDEDRFGTAVLKSMGYQVVIWDVSALVLPLSRQQWRESPQLVTPLVVESWRELHALAQSLAENDACILLSCLDAKQGDDCHSLRSVLFASSAIMCAISSGRLPVPSSTRVLISRVRHLLGQPSHLVPATSARVVHAFGNVKQGVGNRRTVSSTGGNERGTRELDIVWAGTNLANLDATLLGAKTDVRYIHTLDFDQVLSIDFKDAEIGRYCVFLDSMGPMHPDFHTHQLAFPMTMEDYSAVVRRHISAVQGQSGLPVVIAAHPRAKPGSLQEWYGDLEIAHGRTAELIAQSRLVIAASPSTALGIAAVTRRPISLVSGLTLPRETDLYFESFARQLKLPKQSRVIPDGSWIVPGVNTKAYSRYVAQFMKLPGTPRKPFWEVVGDDLAHPRGNSDIGVA